MHWYYTEPRQKFQLVRFDHHQSKQIKHGILVKVPARDLWSVEDCRDVTLILRSSSIWWELIIRRVHRYYTNPWQRLQLVRSDHQKNVQIYTESRQKFRPGSFDQQKSEQMLHWSLIEVPAGEIWLSDKCTNTTLILGKGPESNTLILYRSSDWYIINLIIFVGSMCGITLLVCQRTSVNNH